MVTNRYKTRHDHGHGLYSVCVEATDQVLATFEYGDRAERERVKWQGDYIADARQYGEEAAARMATEREAVR